MGFTVSDIDPFTQALAEQAKAGSEKVFTKNGESHVASINDVQRGMADIVGGRTCDADAAIAQLRKRRSGSTS